MALQSVQFVQLKEMSLQKVHLVVVDQVVTVEVIMIGIRRLQIRNQKKMIKQRKRTRKMML